MKDTVANTDKVTVDDGNNDNKMQPKKQSKKHESEKGNSTDAEQNPPKHPLTSWWGKLLYFTFDWLTPLIFKGLRRQLHIQDVPEMLPGEDTEANYAKLERALHRFQNSRFQLLLAMNVVFGFKFWLAGLFKLIVDLSALVGPGMLVIILRYLDKTKNYPAWSGPVAIAAMFVSQIISVICNNQFQYYGRCVCVCVFYIRKALLFRINPNFNLNSNPNPNSNSYPLLLSSSLVVFLFHS